MSIAVMALLGLVFGLAVALAVVNLVQARRARRRPPREARVGPMFYEHNARDQRASRRT